jgi:predicted permease
MLQNAVLSVLSLVILIAGGYILSDRPWFTESGPDILARFTAKVAMPCYLFLTIYQVCGTRERLIKAVSGLPVPMGAMLMMFGVSLILAKLLRIGKKRRGVFMNAVTFCNTVLIGMPVVEGIFGEQALGEAVIFYIANTLLFWTLGITMLREREVTNPVRSALKGLLSPNLLSAALAAVFLLIGITLPQFIITPINFVGRCTTGLAMLCTGCILRKADLKRLFFSRDMLAIIFTRFLLSPALMLAICLLVPISPEQKRVFMVYSFMPAMTQLGILSRVYDSDYEFASVAVSGTTVLSMGAIPVFAAIMQFSGLFI